MLNEVKVKKLIQLYKEYIKAPQYNELYKWEAIKNFQDNWNIDAEDFGKMLEKCFPGNNNLWAGSHFLPISMLLSFITLDKEKVKAMFNKLYDEELPLLERVNHFIEKSDELLVSLNDSNKRLHYQELRSISVYLAFRYPEKYYLFKITVVKDFAEAIDWNQPFIRGSNNNLKNYYNLADKIRSILVQDNELISEHKKRITEKCYKDSNYTVLTQDLIWISANHLIQNLTEINAALLLKTTSLNTILYGPPGTGKTYSTKEKTIRIIKGNI
jgi:5-methylcytosine-specific restriction protein B